ncbi:MAG TPA: tRNA pseudouridine(55) synthase TruB [Gemmatimonadaceae bacterium]|nr:tRNA pseudouridine(55) synthase TruB [Gemmatimonadaceae bacterium]
MTIDTTSTDGLLLVDKPVGVTSHDVVEIVRRAYHERSIGHLGTLDPFATGLLVLLLGRSTRLATFIENEPKIYEATIRFGAETDTDDCTGTVVREAQPPSLERILQAIPTLSGAIEQLPPAYSAKKVGGVRAYDKARGGEVVTLAPVQITVHEWRIRASRPSEIDVVIVCSGGTYIRALGRDLGRLTDSAAHVSVLRRTGSGEFDVRDAVTVDVLRSDALPPIQPLRVVVGT